MRPLRLRTHLVFTAGSLSLFLSLVYRVEGSPTFNSTQFLYSLTFSFLSSVLANSVIDRLGHESRGGYVRRTPLTHTWYRSIFWGVLGSIPPLLLLPIPKWEVIAAILAGPSHMFLDAFTERGVYVKRRGRWVRQAWAHRRFNDPLSNGLALVSGSLLLFSSFLVWGLRPFS